MKILSDEAIGLAVADKARQAEIRSVKLQQFDRFRAVAQAAQKDTLEQVIETLKKQRVYGIACLYNQRLILTFEQELKEQARGEKCVTHGKVNCVACRLLMEDKEIPPVPAIVSAKPTATSCENHGLEDCPTCVRMAEIGGVTRESGE